jgi:hypothetical protein
VGVTIMWRAPFKVRRSWQRFVDRAYWDSQLED